MNRDLVLAICKAHNLGGYTGQATVVTGGLLHHMWKIETTTGTYAIKELNSAILARPNVVASFILSEQTARQFQDLGIPAITALFSSIGPVLQIANTFVIIYPWVEGASLPATPAPTSQAYLIGKYIGQIHKANLQIPQLQNDGIMTFSNTHWQQLFTNFQNTFPHIIPSSALADIVLYNTEAQNLDRQLKSKTVVSHGDIDQKNVLWRDEQSPVIIDWESVGLVNPGVEIIDAALNWGGIVSGELNDDSIKAVLTGYQEEMVLDQLPEDSLRGCMIKWLPWLEFNMQRALAAPQNSAEQSLSHAQTQITLRTLGLISRHFTHLSSLLSSRF